MADYLVIGCGYLGLEVAHLWLQQGHTVWVTTRKPDRARELAQRGWKPIVCDVLDLESMRSLPHVSTAVYSVGMDRTTGHSMRQVYVEGLANGLAAWKHRADKVIYISSTGVYGQTTGEIVDETSRTEPADESGRVVLEAEQVLRRYDPTSVILRFAGIYGPHRLIRIEALRNQEPLSGNPDGWLNLIHVQDGARAVLAADINAPDGSTFIISDNVPVPRRQFYSTMARLMQTPAPVFAPWNPDHPLPPHLKSNKRLSNRKARVELHWEPLYPSWEKGLEASMEQDRKQD